MFVFQDNEAIWVFISIFFVCFLQTKILYSKIKEKHKCNFIIIPIKNNDIIVQMYIVTNLVLQISHRTFLASGLVESENQDFRKMFFCKFSFRDS